MGTPASERRRGPRRRARLGVRLLTGMALLDAGAVEEGAPRGLSFLGTTRDISAGGLSLVLPSVNIDERYFAGEPRRVEVLLDLPADPIRVWASPLYCRPLAEREPEAGYIVGVRFSGLSETERARLLTYLSAP